jgi:nicotinamidase-related amidase
VLVNVTGTAPGLTEAGRLPQVLPDGHADFLDEIGPQSDDIVVSKTTLGAFATSDLDTRLKVLGVTHVVIAGVATGTGVEATARRPMRPATTSPSPSMR